MFKPKIWKLRRLDDSHEDLAHASCKVCRLLSAIKPAHEGRQRRLLVAASLPRLILGTDLKSSRATSLSSFTVLASGPDTHYNTEWRKNGRYLAVLDKSSETLDVQHGRTQPDHIDYGFVRDLITFCEQGHVICGKQRSVGAVPGFRVVDVRQKKVVCAPQRCRYVALSYVWGGKEAGDLTSPPLVIEDAMSVAAALGCEYLWIDRYVSHMRKIARARILLILISASIRTARRSTTYCRVWIEFTQIPS